MNERNTLIIEKIGVDVFLAMIFLVISITGLIFFSLLSIENVTILVAIILVIIFSVSYIFLTKELKEQKIEEIEFDHVNIDYINIFSQLLFLIFIMLALLSLCNTLYRRPPIFFFTIFLSGGCIILEILTMPISRKNVYILLFQILLLGAILRFSLPMLYPIETNSDAYFHNSIIAKIIKEHHFPTKLGMYRYFPIYHILNSICSIVCDTTIIKSVLLSVGLPSLLTPVLIYAIIKNYTKKERVALLSIFLYLLFPINNFFGWVLTPVMLSISYILTMAYVYLSTKLYKNNFPILFLGPILITSCILTNVAGATFMLVFLSFMIISNFLYDLKIDNKKQKVKYPHAIIYIISLLVAMSLYMALMYKSKLLQYFIEIIIMKSIGIKNLYYPKTIKINVLTKIIGASWFYFVELSILLGILWLARNPKNKKINFLEFFCIISTFGIAIMIGVFKLGGINIVIPYRWFLLLSMPASILVSKAFIDIAFLHKKTLSAVIVFLFLMSVFFILSPASNFDNPIGEKFTPSTGIKVSEFFAALSANYFLNTTQHDRILTDWYYKKVFDAYTRIRVESFHYNISDNIQSFEFLFLRKELNKYPYFSANYKERCSITNKKINIKQSAYNKLYSSNTVEFLMIRW